ncbi:MAG: hypothetical protein KA319_11360, partial [Ferruginibacter sp.]|nr:hypothetical protein [Ferruginibacter sp.]
MRHFLCKFSLEKLVVKRLPLVENQTAAKTNIGKKSSLLHALMKINVFKVYRFVLLAFKSNSIYFNIKR